MMDNRELFRELCYQLNAEPDSSGEVWTDCPSCGKEAKKGTHFSFHEERGGHCFVCTWSGSLKRIADKLKMDTGNYTPPPTQPKPKPKPVVRWRKNPQRLLEQYRNHPKRYTLWRQYKALTPDTIDRWDLGVGRLPFRKDDTWYMSPSEWLIVPLYEDGELVGLRGRNMGSSGPKWISATGTTYALYNAENVQPGSVCWVVENYIDCLLIVQELGHSAVAIGGATIWKDGWDERLAARQPATVIVALDHDLVGNATGAYRRKLEEEWRQERDAKPPQGNGAKIANSLRRAGLEAWMFRYPEHAPAKADIGWLLEQERKQAA